MRARFRTPKTQIDPDLVSRILGQRISSCRLMKNLTQTELGAELGVSFQQIQKYETGRNQVSVPRLLQIAMVLSVTTDTLLDGLMTADELPKIKSGGRSSRQRRNRETPT